MMHDMGDVWGFGYGHWFFGALFWVVVMLVIVALMKYIFSSNKRE